MQTLKKKKWKTDNYANIQRNNFMQIFRGITLYAITAKAKLKKKKHIQRNT